MIVRECDSVPEGRQEVATGASPWYAIKERQKSRRDDRNCDWVVSCRPFRTENHLYSFHHGLAPVAKTCRHIRGSNAGLICSSDAFHISRVLAGKMLQSVGIHPAFMVHSVSPYSHVVALRAVSATPLFCYPFESCCHASSARA